MLRLTACDRRAGRNVSCDVECEDTLAPEFTHDRSHLRRNENPAPLLKVAFS